MQGNLDECLTNLQKSIEDIRALTELSTSKAGNSHKLIIYRSVIVLLIASWEQFIEQLAENSVQTLTSRLRDSNKIPENVKQSIVKISVSEQRSNMRDYSDSVWQFSDKGWKNAYEKFCIETTSKLNVASPKNIEELYKNILGIRDITLSWSFDDPNPTDCRKKLEDLVDIRHDIAHGKNARIKDLQDDTICDFIKFIEKIASDTFNSVLNYTATLSSQQAITYSLSQKCYLKIIDYAVQKDTRILTLNEIKSLGSSAQGNHNKLCYNPWFLLKEIDKKTREVTERMFDFYENKLTLPLEILVFDDGDSISKPDTSKITYSEFRDLTNHSRRRNK